MRLSPLLLLTGCLWIPRSEFDERFGADDSADSADPGGTCATIDAWTPGNNAADVPPDALIKVEFDVEAEGFEPTGFTVTESGDALLGDVEWDGTVATFIPEVPLLPDTKYDASISWECAETGVEVDEIKFTTGPLPCMTSDTGFPQANSEDVFPNGPFWIETDGGAGEVALTVSGGGVYTPPVRYGDNYYVWPSGWPESPAPEGPTEFTWQIDCAEDDIPVPFDMALVTQIGPTWGEQGHAIAFIDGHWVKPAGFDLTGLGALPELLLYIENADNGEGTITGRLDFSDGGSNQDVDFDSIDITGVFRDPYFEIEPVVAGSHPSRIGPLENLLITGAATATGADLLGVELRATLDTSVLSQTLGGSEDYFCATLAPSFGTSCFTCDTSDFCTEILVAHVPEAHWNNGICNMRGGSCIAR